MRTLDRDRYTDNRSIERMIRGSLMLRQENTFSLTKQNTDTANLWLETSTEI